MGQSFSFAVLMHLDCGLCIVRSWRPADLEPLVRHANNRKIWLQLRDRFPHPYTVEQGEAWLRHCARERPETSFAIEAGGEAVGGIGFIPGSDVERCSAEIGYWLAEDLWGRGITTAALGALTEHAFATHGFTRIFAVPFAENHASRRVLEKAGYTLEGILRRSAIKEGQVIDQALYARLAAVAPLSVDRSQK